MPALTLSHWNLSTLTLASTKSKSQRNKLRRRHRPPPLRDMSGNPNGVRDGVEVVPPMPTPMTATSTTRSTSPTLLEKPTSEARERDTDKDDAQALVISSLRAQITDLITQVSQLNSKLVKSYDRVSDLEDELHVASANARATSLKISNLEIERAQHLAALNTGLYVEKEHVTAELTRLMERATSEAAARGQAESARANIEKELDDLSASLFDQANTMVAEARFERAMSERKVVDAEMALKSAEEAVGVMQTQMQALRDEKDRTDDEISRLRILMEKGKFVEHPPIAATTSIRLLSLHAPYQEFMQFIVHLRSIRHSTFSPPHISTLLPLPFLARIQNEDSDPTVRLDLAPSLNWLSRRSVLAAIHNGQLTIEPMSITTLMSESSSGIQSMIAGSQPGIVCALCGVHTFPPKAADSPGFPPPSHPLSSLSLGRHSSSTWSSSLFKNPLSNAAPSPPPTPPRETSAPATPIRSSIGVTTVYVFRLSQAQTSHPPSSYSQSQLTQPQKMTSYPLCASGWCLARLRTTCSLWAFIRAGVVDRVWEEEPAPRPPPSISSASVYSVNSTGNNSSAFTLVSAPSAQKDKEQAPPLPPRRRSKMSSSVGALWGMASGALRSATPNSSQPASPSGKEKENGELPETPPKKATPEPLKVTVPPPLPRRSNDRRVSGVNGTSDEKPKQEMQREESRASPDQLSKETSTVESTPVALSKSGSPPTRPVLEASRMTVANSQTSSALGEEFSTPVEEIGSLPPFSTVAAGTATEVPTVSRSDTPPRPGTPHSKRSSRSSARNSVSPPPRSPSSHPQRVSPPPPPHSPRAIPLPDSRPGTPGTPRRTHVRHESGSVTIVPLNIENEKVSRPPSRATSPRPTGTPRASTPPPLPRRAAARRVVPPPPGSSGTQQTATPPSSGSTDESDAPVPPQSSSTQESDSQEDKVITSEPTTKVDEYDSMPRKSVDGLPPRLPPRRPGHTAQNSVSNGFGGKDDDGRMEATQERARQERLARDIKVNGKSADGTEDDSSRRFVGDVTWEERTWKEIVRLREDMFWARVGAIRG